MWFAGVTFFSFLFFNRKKKYAFVHDSNVQSDFQITDRWWHAVARARQCHFDIPHSALMSTQLNFLFLIINMKKSCIPSISLAIYAIWDVRLIDKNIEKHTFLCIWTNWIDRSNFIKLRVVVNQFIQCYALYLNCPADIYESGQFILKAVNLNFDNRISLNHSHTDNNFDVTT